MTMNSSSDIQSTLASSLELIEKCFAENEEKQYKIKDCLRLLENKRLISKKSIEETFRRIIGLQDDLMRDLNEAIENKAETLRLLLRKLESINGAVKEKREHINNLMKGKINEDLEDNIENIHRAILELSYKSNEQTGPVEVLDFVRAENFEKLFQKENIGYIRQLLTIPEDLYFIKQGDVLTDLDAICSVEFVCKQDSIFLRDHLVCLIEDQEHKNVMFTLKQPMEGRYVIQFVPHKLGYYMLTVKLYGQPILGSPIMVYATPPVRRSNSKYGKSLISQNSFIQSSYYPTFESNTAINKYDCDRRYRSHSKTNLQSISDFRISKYMTDDAAIMDEFNGGRDNKSISSLSSFSNTNQHNVFQNGYHNGNNGNHNGNHNGNQNANLLGNQYQHQNSSYPYNNQSSSSHFANETGNNGGFNSLINSEWPANFRCAFDKGSYKQPQKQVIRYSKEFLLSCAKSPLARTITADLKRNRYILKDAYKTLPDPFYMPANQLPPSTIKDEHLISNRRMDCGDSKEDIIGGIKNKILIADNEKVPISLLGGGNGKAFKIKNENMFGSETDKAPLRNTKMKRSASEITLNSQKNNTKTPDEENVISGDRLKAMIACQNAPSDLPEMIKLPNDGLLIAPDSMDSLEKLNFNYNKKRNSYEVRGSNKHNFNGNNGSCAESRKKKWYILNEGTCSSSQQSRTSSALSDPSTTTFYHSSNKSPNRLVIKCDQDKKLTGEKIVEIAKTGIESLAIVDTSILLDKDMKDVEMVTSNDPSPPLILANGIKGAEENGIVINNAIHSNEPSLTSNNEISMVYEGLGLQLRTLPDVVSNAAKAITEVDSGSLPVPLSFAYLNGAEAKIAEDEIMDENVRRLSLSEFFGPTLRKRPRVNVKLRSMIRSNVLRGPGIEADLVLQIGKWGKGILGTFNFPIGITVCPFTNNIIICDSGNDKIKIFDENGIQEVVIGTSPKERRFTRPSAAVVLDNGNICIKDDFRLQIYTPTGKFLQAFGEGHVNRPYGLSLTKQGWIVTCCYTFPEPTLQFYDSETGKLVKQSPLYTICGNWRQGSKCRFLAVHDDWIAVTDLGKHLVYRVDFDGKPLSIFGGHSNSLVDLIEPSGIAVDHDGNLAIADSKSDRIHVFDKDGQYICPIRTTKNGSLVSLSKPADMCFGPDGCLYIVNLLGHNTMKFKFLANKQPTEWESIRDP